MPCKRPCLIAIIAAFFLYQGGRPGSAEPVDIKIDSLGSNSVKVMIDTTHPPVIIPPPQIISETPIPPATASFNMGQGRIFSYISAPDSAALNPNRPAVEAPQPLSGGFPQTQRIVCLGISPTGDSSIVRLSNNARYGNVRARIAPREIAAFVRTTAIAQLDAASGRVIREINQPSTLPHQVDTLEEKYDDFTATLWDFYGPWMLHLADGFRYERYEQLPFAGITRVSLSVEGRDTVNERECFVVRLIRGAPDRPGSRKTYWVDVAERVTVQAKDDFFILRRIRLPNDPMEGQPEDSSALRDRGP